MLTVRMKRKDALNFVPGGAVNHRLAVIVEGMFPEFQYADVEFVGEEGAIGVERSVEARFGVDLLEGCARGFHFEGGADAGNPIGVGGPAMVDAFFACAEVLCADGLALEAARGCAWDGALLDDGAESIGGIFGGLAGLFFVRDFDEEFDEAAKAALGNVVGEGVDDHAPFADEGFIELRVVHVAGEAGIVPDEEGGGTFGGIFVIGDHALEVFAACGGGSRFGNVLIGSAEDELVLLAKGSEGFELTRDGAVLFETAAVAQVGVYDGARMEVGGWGDVGQGGGDW